jgi:vacuolar iron transporter family protein
MIGASLWQQLKASFAASAGQVVFGMEDGTVSIFGLVFGVAATTNDRAAVLVAGASGAVAAAVSMMAGTYLDVETNRDQARVMASRINANLQNGSATVIDDVARRLTAAGLSSDQTTSFSSFLSSQPAVLKSLATALTTSSDAHVSQSPLVQSLWMLVADFLAAAIPILPFAFLPVSEGRVVSGTVTTLLLIGLGIGRGLIGGRNILRTMIETVAIGVAAALAGVAIGLWISTFRPEQVTIHQRTARAVRQAPLARNPQD